MHITYIDQDGKKDIELQDGATGYDVALLVKKTAPNEAISCRMNGDLVDLATPLHEGNTIEFISFDSPEGKEIFWHTSAHVLAQAVMRLFKDAKPTIGPAIDQGFYYDFYNLTISDEDFEKIEEEMKKIISSGIKPERCVFKTKEEVLEKFPNNPYKKELIEELSSQGASITGYSQGDFFDLCRGPHLPTVGKIKAIKIMKTSGAYWKGDAKNAMLTRIYGISFPDPKMMKEHIHYLEEAKKRDHKILGPKLDLFSLKEEAPGIPFIHPKGMIIWNKLLEYWRELHRRHGYVEIKTPSMMIRNLWERSGHWANYRDNMFTSTIEDREFAIKPMNCPGAMLFYRSAGRSYRDLPWKVGEIGLVHRYESSGSLSGLFRVRSFHQDDAHIFMEPKDITKVINDLLGLVEELYGTFGLTYKLVLSTRPKANTIGTDEDWERATDGLRSALLIHGKPFAVAEGDGAFYGPKIDIHVFDALGRTWQCGTIQLDMALPERFDLEYTAQDGTKKRPVMAHRAILGSIERFFGALIEFYQGKFPLWLSPCQVAIIPVADRHLEYAMKRKQEFVDLGFEVKVFDSPESVSKKVREAQLEQFNYILTVGDKELEGNTVAVRTRDNVLHGDMESLPLIEILQQERKEKLLSSPLKSS